MSGGGKGGSDAADQARADEIARQNRIKQGTNRINSIFDSGNYGTDAIAAGSAYDPNKTYYLADGSVWTPGSKVSTGTGGGQFFNAGAGGGANSFANLVKSGQLFGGTHAGGAFNDDFYNTQQQNYLNYANPQLQDQYADAQKQLAFSLDRAGITNSSARAQKTADLQKLYDRNLQQINDQALTYKTQAQNNVEDARSNLISTLNATGDAQGAANSAIARAGALSQPQQYSPLGNLFSDFLNTLGIQSAAEKATALSGGSYQSPYSTGLFGGGKNSVSVS